MPISKVLTLQAFYLSEQRRVTQLVSMKDSEFCKAATKSHGKSWHKHISINLVAVIQ